MNPWGGTGRWGVVAAGLMFASSSAAWAQPTNRSPFLIDLPATLRLAGARNLDIQVARQGLQEAEANHLRALEQFFPWLAPGIGYQRRDGLAQAVPAGTLTDAHFDAYAPGVGVGAQVDLGGAIYQSLASRQLVKAANAGLEAQRLDALLSAAQGYLDLAQARALVGVVEEALHISRDYQGQLHEAVAAGIAFKGDELRVQTQTERYQIALRQAQERQRVLAAALAALLHLDSRVELVPLATDPAPLTLVEAQTAIDPLVEQALRLRPELKRSQALVGAARAEKQAAVVGPLIPSLGAQVFAGGLGGGPDNGPSAFGSSEELLVGLSWRLGPGGLFDTGRQRARQARLESTRLSGEKLRDQITAEVVQSLTRVRSLADQLALARRNLVTARDTWQLTHARKDYGVGLVLEDIQAQQALAQARAEYVTVIAEFDKAQYDLNKAVGGAPPLLP